MIIFVYGDADKKTYIGDADKKTSIGKIQYYTRSLLLPKLVSIGSEGIPHRKYKFLTGKFHKIKDAVSKLFKHQNQLSARRPQEESL